MCLVSRRKAKKATPMRIVRQLHYQGGKQTYCKWQTWFGENDRAGLKI